MLEEFVPLPWAISAGVQQIPKLGVEQSPPCSQQLFKSKEPCAGSSWALPGELQAGRAGNIYLQEIEVLEIRAMSRKAHQEKWG